MKYITTLLFLLLNVWAVSYGQKLTANFSADNCYAVYLGDENGVTHKILPDNNHYGVINDKAHKIFNATSVTTNYSPGQWFYVIAWSDDRHCQGLIGEFSSVSTLQTGDPGWEVMGTKRDADDVLSQAPDQNEINNYIAQANSTQSWKDPVVGLSNDSTRFVCSSYSSVDKVKGISGDAKWVWHDTGKHNHPNAPFAGYNHDEFLVFRFPVRLVEEPGDHECCHRLMKQLQEMQNGLQKIKQQLKIKD